MHATLQNASESLGLALGLDHDLYAGYDKRVIRLLAAYLGTPLALTSAAAAVVLSHPDVGWSMERLEVWWAAQPVSDYVYTTHGSVVICLLRLVCILPPCLALFLGIAAGIFVDAAWGLAGMSLLPALTIGFWAFARARHLRWQYSFHVKMGLAFALCTLLLAELTLALAPPSQLSPLADASIHSTRYA